MEEQIGSQISYTVLGPIAALVSAIVRRRYDAPFKAH